MIDLACAVHVHSRYSDGSGTVAEIAAAAADAGVDVVLLTDHDTLAARDAGDERWHGPVLVCVGEEVTQRPGHHYLAFGLEQPIDHRGMTPREVAAAVAAAGGFGILAHPFSAGSPHFRFLPKAGWDEIPPEATGFELWSLFCDTVERLPSLRAGMRFVADPDRVLDTARPEAIARWDELTAQRRITAVGGLDAHQVGLRLAGRVPLRVLGYRRSFRLLQTHVLLDQAPSGEAARDRDAVYGALREGRCYLARDSLAPARGFACWAERPGERVELGAETAADERFTLHVHLPRAATIRVLRDGLAIAARHATDLELPADAPGVYRVEAWLHADRRSRAWIYANPIYLR
ncbi:MAG: phosphoesterase, PHP-like protein [Conexibacter sp.]|nr:phosphoesterase, PHP-like protein [Conexibacter sp.]